MSEVYTTVRASFEEREVASAARKQITEILEANNNEITRAFNAIQSIPEYEALGRLTFEDMTLKNGNLALYAYSGRIEPPTWIADTLTHLGAKKVYIRTQYDEGGNNYYFLDGKRVSKKTYEGDTPEKRLTAKDIEINKNLFLPEGRVRVKATLVSHWEVGDMYESLGMQFQTEDGHTFYHKGTGKLTQLASQTLSNTCEFSAVFERGKLDGEYVSFAKRPSKITFSKATS